MLTRINLFNAVMIYVEIYCTWNARVYISVNTRRSDDFQTFYVKMNTLLRLFLYALVIFKTANARVCLRNKFVYIVSKNDLAKLVGICEMCTNDASKPHNTEKAISYQLTDWPWTFDKDFRL